MEIINWVIDLLPTWVWSGILVFGIISIIASWAIKFLPSAVPYRFPLFILGFFAVISGIYHMGSADNEKKWQERMKAIQAQMTIAEEKSRKENAELESKYKNKVKTITEKGDTITKYILSEVTMYDKSCPIPISVVKSHNAAATNDISEVQK